MNIKEHMTQEMLDALLDQDEMVVEYKYAHAKYRKAYAAYNAGIPATAASGLPVVHGARMHLNCVADYWSSRRELARTHIPREIVYAIDNDTSSNV